MRSIENNPMDQEVSGGRFTHQTKVNSFRGQELPSDFEITVSETANLTEGQVIGRSRLGKIIRWVGGSVISRG